MKIVLATGGSGGHIFPALETAKELRRRGHDVCLMGALTTAVEKIQGLGFKYYHIDAKGLTRYSLSGMLGFGVSMLKALRQSFAILKEYQPDKIVGFGGYGSFAVIGAGVLLNKPTMIHEQNVMPGKANRLLAAFVKRIAISFNEGRSYFPSSKIVWTGCPSHQGPALVSREQFLLNAGLNPKRQTIALLGGSQGSKYLNDVFVQVMRELAGSADIQAIHMTGKNDYLHYEKLYRDEHLPVAATAFISPIEDLYGAVDYVIARAGAATISELGANGIAAVLVPYPFAGNHQRYNGLVLSQAGAANLIDQQVCDAKRLRESLEQLRTDEYSRSRIKIKTKNLFLKEPAVALAVAIESL